MAHNLSDSNIALKYKESRKRIEVYACRRIVFDTNAGKYSLWLILISNFHK